MKLEIFIVFVISFELIVRISSSVIEHTDDCPDPVLYDFQVMRRSGDNIMIRCTLTDKRWHMTCRNGEWIGEFRPCFSGSGKLRNDVHVYCRDPVTIGNEDVLRRNGDHATVYCYTNGAEWHLTCVNGEWTGEREICPIPICPELTYDKDVYEISTVNYSWVVMVSCREPNPDGRRKSWIIVCSGGKWSYSAEECDGRPH